MNPLNYVYDNTLGKHYQNTDQLRAATRQGLISEPQYKTMSGYDASQTIPGITDNPVVTGAASGAYNIAKSILSPQDYFNKDYQAQIGPIDSTVLNTLGSLGLSPQDKEKYEGIISLDPKSLTGNWMPEDLTDFSGVYDDNEPGFIDPSNPQLNKAGLGVMSFLGKKFGPKIASYLKNKALSKIGKKVIPSVLTGGAAQGAPGGYTGPITHDFDPKQDTGQRPDKPGGFTDPGKGSYGPHMAYGGRAGYFDGGLASLWLR